MIDLEQYSAKRRSPAALTYRAASSFPIDFSGRIAKLSYTSACVMVALYYGEAY